MRIVDLSHPLTTGMPVYPGDPTVSIAPALHLADDGVAVAHLSLGSHSGTHLDAPSHSIAGGRTVDRIPLDLLQGEAMVLHVQVAAHHRITAADLPRTLPARLPRIVCVATGWDRVFAGAGSGAGSGTEPGAGVDEPGSGMEPGAGVDEPGMLDHPVVAPEFARELWARGARVLGVDMLSPDPSGELGDGTLPVHEIWLGQDGVIVENLAGLTALPDRVEMIIAPLPLAGADGSPVRAMALVATDSADLIGKS